MKSIVTILVIFFVQRAYLRSPLFTLPEPNIMEDIGKLLQPIKDSCILGVNSISTLLPNSISTDKNISSEQICSSIGPSKLVAFIIHGFVSSPNSTEMQKLSTELTKKGYTVFATDWSQGACTNGIPLLKFAAYPSAVHNTREIGQHIAKNYVYVLIEECKIPLENIIFIGHSLGAHVAGFAAKEIYKLSNKKPSLIIAADPASPLFSLNKCDNRLCKTDAERVNVLHTSSLGLSEPVGHLDLQINNAEMQPGCAIDIACSHTRSVVYTSEMVSNKCGFLGVPMEKKPSIFKSEPPYPNSNTTNCIFMSTNILDKDCPITGQYYVFVEKEEPYCTQNTFNCQQ